MKDWMTIKDLGSYLQLSQNKIRFFVKHKRIPFYDKHGILRFSKEEIDRWMKTPAAEKTGESAGKDLYIYRDRPIREYALTATKILTSMKAWSRLPGFIRNLIERVNDTRVHDNGRDYLHRREFSLFSDKYGDYVNICCQLGLIEKKRGKGREKRYYPTVYAASMAGEDGEAKAGEIILDAILETVKNKSEASPDERHAILLLWYILTLREKGSEPAENHFRRNPEEFSYYPSIRLNFSKSLSEFLFGNDRSKEKAFLHEWNGLIKVRGKSTRRSSGKDKLTLFD